MRRTASAFRSEAASMAACMAKTFRATSSALPPTCAPTAARESFLACTVRFSICELVADSPRRRTAENGRAAMRSDVTPKAVMARVASCALAAAAPARTGVRRAISGTTAAVKSPLFSKSVRRDAMGSRWSQRWVSPPTAGQLEDVMTVLSQKKSADRLIKQLNETIRAHLPTKRHCCGTNRCGPWDGTSRPPGQMCSAKPRGTTRERLAPTPSPWHTAGDEGEPHP